MSLKSKVKTSKRLGLTLKSHLPPPLNLSTQTCRDGQQDQGHLTHPGPVF